ncbi:MAG: Do family serine endopeptidase [Planctomycetales bacterium]|nr:Do family serine endopeptidase [Planctomycetales bacterium]
MRQLLATKYFAAGAMAATVMAIGAVAATYAGHRASVIPVTYSVKAAPPVSPAEAERAVASAKDLSTAFRVASESVLPAVVTIENRPRAVKVSGDRMAPNGLDSRGDYNPFEGTPFEDFFQERGFRFEAPRTPPQSRGGGGGGGVGSGVIIDAAGIVMTNNHVVAGDGEVTVRLHDDREFKAVQVWTDPKTDIAIVKIDATGLPSAKFGDSDTVSVGDWVLALGQPFGLEDTVTAGIISAKHRGIGIAARESFLQTDAAINPGNSGGPLVNLDGEVVGINTAISSRTGGNEGIGFAVPVNLAKWIGDQLVKHGEVRRAYLGVSIQPVTAPLAEQLHVRPREGVAVSEVLANTPAAKAGVQAGDVIVEYAGVAVSSPNELQLLVERSDLGKPHLLTVIRDGRRRELSFTPETQPSDFGSRQPAERPMKPSEQMPLDRLGMEVGRLDAAVAEQLGMSGAEGVVITDVQAGGLADRAGLESGMVITQANRQPVRSVEAFTDMVKQLKPDEGMLLLVRSQNGSRFVVLK